MSSRYPLRTVLQLRLRARERGEQALARAVGQLGAARREAEAIERALRELSGRRTEATARHRDAEDRSRVAPVVQRGEAFLERLRSEEEELTARLETQRRAVGAAELLVERRRAELLEKAREHEALRNHEDRWRAEERLHADAVQDRAQDDLNAARFAISGGVDR